MKDFKYIKNYAEGGEGTILLYDAIGTLVDPEGRIIYGISGSSFAQEMQYLQKVCSSINIRINSVGGSVIDGYSIVSAILNSKVPCNTYIDGLAASISAVIAVSGNKCFISDYGTMMIHSVSGGDNKDVLDIFENTIVTILSNRCGKTKDEVAAMMVKETWMKPAEALEMGFVDGIIPSEKKMKIKKTENVFALANLYNSLINKPNMKKSTSLLNIAEDAGDDLMSSKIADLKAENEALKAKNAENEAKLADIAAKELEAKNAADAKLKSDAEAVVNKGVADKKITAEEAVELLNTASSSEANLKSVTNILAKIGTVKNAIRVDEVINSGKKSGADKDAWTIRDWEKKDPKGLKEMAENNKAEYDELYNAYYKKGK